MKYRPNSVFVYKIAKYEIGVCITCILDIMAYTIVGQSDAYLLTPHSIGCHGWFSRTLAELVS